MRKSGILPVLTAAEMRQVDTYTIEQRGVPGEVLMGNAARGVMEELTARFPAPTTRVGIFCGQGNNGGDGLALAHLLWLAGRRNFKVFVVAPDPSRGYTPDAGHYLNLLREDGIEPIMVSNTAQFPVEAFAMKVDALFGTGLDRPLDDFWRHAIDAYAELAGFSLAVDCPSGLNASTGEVMGAVASADCTVTMGYPKAGFFTPEGLTNTGELAIAHIGLCTCEEAGVQPQAFAAAPGFFELNPIPPRQRNVHKGHFGRIVILAGSHGFSGAAKMCGLSALRAGAGLVRLFVPAEVYVPVASGLTEVMVGSFDPHNFTQSPGGLSKLAPEFEWADLLALGSGLSLREELQDAAHEAIARTSHPLICDAEGCFAAQRWLREQGDRGAGERPVLLTPHLGEFARLLDVPLENAAAEPVRYAREFCAVHRCHLLVKSAATFLCTPEGVVLYPPAGSPALAKGGSGDVLVGAIAARAAIALKAHRSGFSPYEGDYLTPEYYAQFPAGIPEEALPLVEGILRGYSLFAEASQAAARLAASEESVLAGEISELLNAQTEFVEG
jgi:hydroxyethylthiazole kinase-like uncharacterized protein yjeF